MRRRFGRHLAASLGVVLCGLATFAAAVPPPPGTVISNVATGTSTQGALTGVASTSNTVSLTVGGANTPQLTKFFSPASIQPGGTTSIIFDIANAVGNPASSGIAFTDTLPPAILLTANSNVSFGAGCSGIATLTQPSTIAVSGVSLNAGLANCVITVSNLTVAPNQTNADCGSLPPSFTNSASSISALANAANAVTPQCLLVRPPPPTLTKSFGAAQIVDGGSTPLTFTLTNSAGNPSQAGISFVDQLPSGLQLASNTLAYFNGTNCFGQVVFSPPQTIMVQNFSMGIGTVMCTIMINGVTNAPGMLNTQCGMTNNPAFTNDATSVTIQTNAIGNVTPQCLLVAPKRPVLTKQFAPTQILDGGKTVLTFTITNLPQAPALSGASFTDTLPVGLRLMSGAAVALQGTGCQAQVSLVGNNQIAVTNLAMAAGTMTCSIVIDGVTNVAGSVNSSCTPIAPNFTNGAGSIGNLSQLNNGVQDACLVVQAVDPVLNMTIAKSLSASQGLSPSGPYTVRLAYANTATVAAALKRNVTINDALPAGMTMVPGSLRIFMGTISVTPSTASGAFSASGRSGTFSTASNQVSVTLATVPPGEQGEIVFEVAIASGLAPMTVLNNTAQLTFTDSLSTVTGPLPSNTVSFRVTDSAGVTLRGMTLDAVQPGSTLVFENVLTNTGSRPDTFDITLSGSTFPTGSIITLLQSDGVTPLADTSGNGIPDTGVVAPGASYRIVVRVVLPPGVGGGPYRVTKNARSTSNSIIRASDDDVVTTIVSVCRITFEPDNNGQVRPGDSIVYGHLLTNIGTCVETMTFPVDFSTGTSAGWTAELFLDSNANASTGSIVGVIDSTDQRIRAGSQIVVGPGERVRLLARITAPTSAANGATDVTTFRVTNTASQGGTGNSGSLSVRDTTVVGASTSNTDIIRGYVDSNYRTPTVWAFIGRDFYLRAVAPSCNAVPDVIERRTIIITGPNGEREEIIAIETGPNTGIFVAEGLLVRRPPVTASDNILEGNPYDTYDVEIVGCGRRISTTVTLVDPNGVVFDSLTNEPVAGAVVRLFNATNGMCTTTPATVQQLVSGQIVPAPNVLTTAADGRFDFPLVSPGEFCVTVTPPNGYTWISNVPADQLPAGRLILATGPRTGGSYGGAFRVGPETGPVILDVPVDPGAIGGLFIRKEALRTTVELGEFTDYVVTVNNATGYALTRSDVFVTDDLPAGFAFVRGSARLNGQPLADPQGGTGPRLTFNLGRIAKDAQPKLTYRVRVGPGALQGDGVNRVVASYRVSANGLYSQSNVATAKVLVTGGVFSDRAYIVGKVFADCDKDGVQRRARGDENAEVGIPGVRLYLEDGTNVITDAEGKFSFYGISPRTHVLKLDRTSLPSGVSVRDLEILSQRNLGKPDSRIVDVRNGELHRANFAINGCAADAMAEIDARRRAASSRKTELDGRLQERLVADSKERQLGDVKALPASGVVGQFANNNALPTGVVAPPGSTSGGVATVAGSSASRFDTLAQSTSTPLSRPHAALPPGVTPVVLLEDLMGELDNGFAILDLKDGDVLSQSQIVIRIKGVAGTVFKLFVNDREVPESHVGKKAVLDSRQLQAWEFIGVDLVAGENSIRALQLDAFGKPRGEKTVRVKAPGELAQFKIEFGGRISANGGAVADGRTPVKVIVKLLDKVGLPITARTAVTMHTDQGRWDVEDLNTTDDGWQVFIEGGRGEFTLLPPSEPATAKLTVIGGNTRAETKLDFLPDLRELVAAGLIEGILNLRKLDTRALVPARQQDSFEQEITHIARTWGDGKTQAGARAAFFLKGKIKGEYLLTLAYDSDKNTRERLFRDIQPDEFYPVYGDSASRGFDAQSTGRFYLRVDNKKSYLLVGDFNTAQSTEVRRLSNYSRSLTGIKQHYETGAVSANIFASRDSTKQIVDEFRANGTSGPFTLSNARGLINSEKIEILTRDRNQTSVIVRSVPLARFVDYELEPLTGRILLKAPVPSLDEFLNPIFLRITYEVDQGGPEFWVAGADAQVKLTDNLEVGAVAVEDRNPSDKFRMLSVNAIAKLATQTFFIAEIARTEREQFASGISSGAVSGSAYRAEIKHQNERLEANVFYATAQSGFDNPGASLSKGRTEAGGKFSYRLDGKTRLLGELLHTEDNSAVNGAAGAKRDGALLSFERALSESIRLELGLRHARDTQPIVAPAAGTTVNQPTKQEVTTIRARMTGQIPGLSKASAYAEAEVDVQDADRKVLALGGDYQLPNNGRLYARHEFISSITGPYGLTTQQRQNATVIGVNTDYMKDGSLFSEYRIRDALSGGDAEAALGLRNTWTLRDGLRLQTGFERVHALSGTGNAEATAATFGLEYTANPLWKGSTRLEIRDGKNSDSYLSTVAIASKLNRDWTFLGRNTYSLIKNKGISTGENTQDRFQLGLAYRDTEDDRWNGLGRVEHRTEKDTTQSGVELKRSVDLISIHANWQPRRPFTFTGRYASKWVTENSNGVNSRTTTDLIAARAVWEFAPRWDVSVHASTLQSRSPKASQYGLGLELGFLVMENLWLSAGYNWFGYTDKDLTVGEYTNKGAYIRLRYKFDEDLFGRNKSVPATAAQTTADNGAADAK